MRFFSVGVAGAAVMAIVLGWSLSPSGAAAAARPLQAETGGATASADLQDPQGKSLGTATLTETPNGVLVTVELSGLPAGQHALHLHETGQCDSPDFKSAGGHFNPESTSHGFKNSQGLHAGDLPNVTVDADGVLNVDAFAMGVTLGSGSSSLFDDDGAAVVMHEGADDYETDPAGDAGSRIACGVVEASR